MSEGKKEINHVFTLEDIDNCWEHYKDYLIDILNGNYNVENAKEDLLSLINSKYDKRNIIR